jgi:hypothetical protein
VQQKTSHEQRIEHLEGIIRDVGLQAAMPQNTVTQTDGAQARLALEALARGENPPPTEREETDGILNTYRGPR